MSINFVIVFDIVTDVYAILFQNRLKVTPPISFVGTMTQRESAKGSTGIFSTTSNIWFKVRHNQTSDL